MFKLAILAILAAGSVGTADAGRDAVLEWNEIMVANMAEMPPTTHTRLGAMMHLAMLDAMNGSGGHKAADEAAAIAAAHRVLRAAFSEQAAELDAARAKSLARIPEGPGKQQGIAAGVAAAVAMIAAREADGSEPPEFHQPDSTDPGVWQLTAGCPPVGGVFKHWRTVTPFALKRADQFRSAPPPPLTSHRYARAYEEVKLQGDRNSATRPQDRADVARMYAIVGDGILWNPVARQLAASGRYSPRQNARIFALLNVALADAAIAVTETKYHYNTWRPETAVPAAATDGNERTEPNNAYQPFIETPCFPGVSVRACRAESCGARSAGALLWGAWPPAGGGELATPRSGAPLHHARGHDHGHRRCARLRRHSLSIRSDCRRGTGTPRGRVCAAECAAAGS